MYLNTKSKTFFLFLIICFISKINARAQGCVDTIVSKQFNVENFGGTSFSGSNYQDSLGNLYLLGGRRGVGIPNDWKNTMVKFNSNKKIIWSKSYKGSIGFDDFAFVRRMIGQDKEHNLYFISSLLGFGGIGNSNNASFLKLDSSGNIIASKLLVKQTGAPTGYGFGGYVNPGKIFSTLIIPYTAIAANVITFCAIDKNLTAVRWSKSYKPSFNNFIGATVANSIELDDTTSIITSVLVYKNPLNLSDTIYTFNFLKIQSLTGNILAQKSYSCLSLQNPNKTVYAFPRAININYVTKEIIFQSTSSANNNTAILFLKIDENLNIIDTAQYMANASFNNYNFNNLNRNDIFFNGTYTQNGVTKFAAIEWKNNLQLSLQRSYYSNQFTGNPNYVSLTSKNTNNSFNYFIATSGTVVQNDYPIYLFDNIKNPDFEFDCADKAVGLFSRITANSFRTDTVSFIEQPGLVYNLINSPNTYTVQNNNFSEQKYCDLVSICTSLKIQGKSSFCLNYSNVDSFKLIKNNTCLRKTIWAVDNSQMQILASNDTSVRVKFLQPFKGYIKAAYENCLIADSMYIEVDTMYNIKTGVYIGPDTVQCIGKSITLIAPGGFKKYEWQNGSTLNSFTTNDTGLFHIKVMDSCNNTFRDSMYIFPNPKKLNLAFGSPLCEYDTAKIILPAEFTNYSWQPLNSTIQTGNTLLLFPTGTTIYTINAQSHNNCFIQDTLLIVKKNCYGSLYFPTAFTPNNDGKNDKYQASAIGILQAYSLTIYNRYGNMVFHTNDINNGWDGKYKNKTQTGGYTWVCTYTFRSRKQERESGSFLLLQ